MTHAATANTEMARYWDEVSGPKWVALQPVLDRQIGPLGELVLERAELRPGHRVLDVGCGCGGSTLAAAERVAPGGEVLGLDLSRPMLAHARERACRQGAAHVRFLHADAQTTALPDGFDVLVSRFGVMFFDAPEVAFSNLRRALRPGGRLAFVCWQALARNPWMAVPVEAVARLIPLPTPPAPDAPGPFAFADATRVGGILERAGFGEVRFESVEQELCVGPGDLDGAVSLLLELGPAGAALREAPDRQRVQAAAAEALRAALAPYLTSEGVRMPSSSWIVTARNPAT